MAESVLASPTRRSGGLLLGALLALACDGSLHFEQPSEPSSASGGEAPGSGGFAGKGSATPGGVSGHGASDGEPSAGCRERCAAAELLCKHSTGSCVECEEDSDCRRRGLTRCTFEGRCVACFEHHDCELLEQRDDSAVDILCEPFTNSCVKACYDDERQCREYDCEPERRFCAACDSDADCVSDSRGRRCIGSRTRCGCRTDAECAGGYCDPVLFSCVECRDSRDCAEHELCDPSAHRCR